MERRNKNKCKHLQLSNGDKIIIYEEDNNGAIVFLPQFRQLWSLLAFVGRMLPFSPGIVTDFPLPPSSTSNLFGIPFLTDPQSVVRVLSFTNDNPTGPIINDGFILETFSSPINMKISWMALNPTKNFKIGFYLSDTFFYNQTNRLELICGNKGPSIFPCRRGTFISPYVGFLYVAVNEDTSVNVTVRVSIPNQIFSPVVTPEQSYTEFITVRKNCKKFNVPVFTIRFAEDIDGPFFLKTVSKFFQSAERVIRRFLDATSLTITLFTDEELITSKIKQNIKRALCPKDLQFLQLQQPPPSFTYTNLSIAEVLSLVSGQIATAIAGTVTDNNPSIPDSEKCSPVMFQGVNMSIIRNTAFRLGVSNFLRRISFVVIVNTPAVASVDITISLTYIVNSSRPEDVRLTFIAANPNGTPSNMLARVRSRGNQRITATLLLLAFATDVSLYFEYNGNIDNAAECRRNTIVESITVEYILPTQAL